MFSVSRSTSQTSVSCKVSCFPNREGSRVWSLVDPNGSSSLDTQGSTPEMDSAKELEECQKKLEEMTEVAKRLEAFCENAPFVIGTPNADLILKSNELTSIGMVELVEDDTDIEFKYVNKEYLTRNGSTKASDFVGTRTSLKFPKGIYLKL